MALKRSLLLAATATTLGIGGMLLPGATAMASTPDQAVTAAPASRSTTMTTETSSMQPTDTCYEEWYVDDWGNYSYYWVCW